MILDDIAAYAEQRVKYAEKKRPLEDVRRSALELPKGTFPFTRRIGQAGLSFICEVKKASPSRGMISEDFPYVHIAREYEESGADCISCLTEPKWFLGSDDIFEEIRKAVSIPLLRKDFIVSSYQLYESKCMGADAILLICALLSDEILKKYLQTCRTLGLSALVEAHDADEIRKAAAAGAEMIGVNNRDLKDFSVDTGNAGKLAENIPGGSLFVAESGIMSAEDVKTMREAGADAVLIGEAMMRAADKKAEMEKMRSAVR